MAIRDAIIDAAGLAAAGTVSAAVIDVVATGGVAAEERGLRDQW